MDSGPVAAAAWAPINTTDSTNAPHHHAAAQAALGGGMPSSQRRVLLLSFERGGGRGKPFGCAAFCGQAALLGEGGK
jgi:hypothetical protein